MSFIFKYCIFAAYGEFDRGYWDFRGSSDGGLRDFSRFKGNRHRQEPKAIHRKLRVSDEFL